MNLLTPILNFIRPASANAETLKLLATLQSQGLYIMATLVELQTAVSKLASNTANEKTESLAAQLASTNAIKDLRDQVAALRAQIANGTAASSTDLDALLAQINGIDTAVQAIIPAI